MEEKITYIMDKNWGKENIKLTDEGEDDSIDVLYELISFICLSFHY